MKPWNIFWLLPLMLLAACGGSDKQQVDTSTWERARLAYSYPYPNQTEVSVQAPIVLRFTHAFSEAPTALDQVNVKRLSDGQLVPVSRQRLTDGKGVVLAALQPLEYVTQYEVVFGDIPFTQLNKDFDSSFTFTTRAATRGAKAQRITDESFRITRKFPDGDRFEVMDFSSFRFQFSQPIDLATVSEEAIQLTVDGQPVAATLQAKGSYLTIDPVEDMAPGKAYQLTVSLPLQSIYGTPLAEDVELNFVPQDTTPRGYLWQSAEDSEEDTVLSMLTGQPINKVPLKSVLLGSDTSAQTSGDLFADLAFLPNFPDSSPLRIAKASMLEGASLDVMVGGKLDSGLTTGAVNVTFINDGIGYLIPSLYSDHPEVSKNVLLLMDVAMTAEESTANGGLSQDILHVELFGTMRVVDGDMVIDAIGVVEPEVLGMETAYGVMSFNVRAPYDQNNAPPPFVDNSLPRLQSWIPGEHADKSIIGEPIILTFSKPLDGNSLKAPDAIRVLRDDLEQDFDWALDGSSVVLRLHEGLQPPATGSDGEYRVLVSGEITDLLGNPLEEPYDLNFRLPTYVEVNPASPLPLTLYPGFPCVNDATAVTVSSVYQGRCIGGQSGDDELPVQSLAANRPIRVQFSKNMDPDSIILNQTFLVQRHEAGDSVNVAGDLRLTDRLLEFWPSQAWQEGALYSYTLVSNGNRRSATVNCDQAICSMDGYPLQTQWLSQSADTATTATGGGNNLRNYFKGAARTSAVFQALRGLPSFDVNANLVHDSAEQGPACNGADCITPFNSTRVEKEGSGASGGFISQVNIGCGFDGNTPQSCPEKSFLYLTGALNGEVLGYDENEDAVRVDIHPTAIHASELFTVARVGLGALGIMSLEAPTGPQLMRMRYAADESGARILPITAWIRETEEGLILESELELYMDAPGLEAGLAGILTVSHDLLSKPLTLKVSGPVKFLPDGRMHIEQLNLEPVSLSVKVTPNLQIGIAIPLLPTDLLLNIPAGGANLSYITEAVKQ